jgi:hypothetical protein
MAEALGIHSKVAFYDTNGYLQVFNLDGWTPQNEGKTVYDALPERVGLTVFLVWVAAVLFAWPLMLLKIDSNPNHRGHQYYTNC